MSALAVVEFDALKDKTYRRARLGPDVAAFLAWFELGGASRWWHRCLDDAGVKYRTPHVARHTMATRWRQRGLASDDLAVLLGHESVRTTIDLYEQIEFDDVASRMALIEASEGVS